MFVHAGLRPQHLRGAGGVAEAEEVMENMNAGAAAWLLGSGKAMPNVLFGEDSPVWTRVYSSPDSRDVDEAARAELEEVTWNEMGRGGGMIIYSYVAKLMMQGYGLTLLEPDLHVQNVDLLSIGRT